jgi:hypothetical protein
MESPVTLTRVVSARDESRRLLELRLMHRWSSTTYKSLCSSALDETWLQIHVPEWALKHNFLLHGIFAMSAMETMVDDALVDETQAAMLLQAAMEYYDMASTSFRRELFNVTAENFHSVYMFSFFAVAMCMVMPHGFQEPRNGQQGGVLGRTALIMNLLNTCSHLAANNLSMMVTGPSGDSVESVVSVVEVGYFSPGSLTGSTEDALVRLSYLVELDADAKANGTYRHAVDWLRVCFTVESNNRDTVAGFCFAWPSLAGHDFIVAFSKADVRALLIVMHWAVLLHSYGKVAWWVASVGRDIVAEISRVVLLSFTPETMLPDIQLSIAWARQQVGFGLESTQALQHTQTRI